MGEHDAARAPATPLGLADTLLLGARCFAFVQGFGEGAGAGRAQRGAMPSVAFVPVVPAARRDPIQEFSDRHCQEHVRACGADLTHSSFSSISKHGCKISTRSERSPRPYNSLKWDMIFTPY